RNISDDTPQKNRKLGTKSLLRIAKRLGKFPEDAKNLHLLLSRCLLAEFLPATERMSLEALFEDTGIRKLEPP
ncbi:hypothetical protein MPER_16174, partial [Moniliophthora perniciosa FA553]